MYTNSLLLLILLTTTTQLISSQQPAPNQHTLLDFDETLTQTQTDQTTRSNPAQEQEQEQEQTQIQTPSSTDGPPAPTPPSPSGLAATMIKRLTGWNDSVVGKLTGQISPRAPHPFVVPITDQNFHQVVEAELDSSHPGWGSDDQTVWVISVVATDRSSTLFEDQFHILAANSSLASRPIPPKKRDDELDLVQKSPDDPYLFPQEIRFGRIDYMDKTDLILTKWLIFKCPVLMIITRRGSELRFFKLGTVPPTADYLGEFLRDRRWTQKPVWNSTFSRGNSGEWVVLALGQGFKAFHTLTDTVPGWVLMIVSSMLGTSLMQWFHKSSANPRNPPRPTKPAAQDLASADLKTELARAAVHLAQVTENQLLTPHSTTTQRRKK